MGVVSEGFEVCESDVVGTVRAAIEALKVSGRFAAVEEISIPMHKDGKTDRGGGGGF